MKIPRQLRYRFHRHVTSWLPRSFARSDRPLSIVMPLAEKDVARAGIALAAQRRHLMHPIEAIVVPGQKSALIAKFCADEGLRYIDETELLPRAVLDLDYRFKGYNLNGWIRQQVLKLTAPSYVDAELIAVFDADTVLLRDISFFDGARQILFTADEYVASYHAMTQKLLGPGPRPKRSFVAHFMLLQRDLLLALTSEIEARHGCGLVEAILKNLDTGIAASLSEYELYGTYVTQRHPARATQRYWYNVKAKTLGKLTLGAARRFNSVSDHVY